MYEFLSRPASAKSLVHSIIHLGDDLVGIELGVFEAINFCFLLQSCPNIKTLHGVDAYKPYEDFVYAGQVVDEAKIEFINMVAYHNIKFSGEAHRAKIHVMDTLSAVDRFEDGAADFIFQDAYLSYEQAMKELAAWYPKLRQGGIYSGHDYNDPKITRAVNDFREQEHIVSRMSICDDCWMWYKD
jgi:hypothetical protein